MSCKTHRDCNERENSALIRTSDYSLVLDSK
jgi:hypothetical protein